MTMYTREQQIEDGMLFQLPVDLTKDIYKYPVFVSCGVHDLVETAVKNKRYLNDYDGVYWDILHMSRAPKKPTDSFKSFQVIITGTGRKRNHTMWMECVTHDWEAHATVITIYLPEEY